MSAANTAERFSPSRSGAAFRESIGIAPETTLVGFVGRMSWEKGPDKFVQVAQRIRQCGLDILTGLDSLSDNRQHFLATRDGGAEVMHPLRLRGRGGQETLI